MGLIRIERNPSGRQLTVFGVAWLVFFSVIGGLVLSDGGSGALAVTLLAMAVAVPVAGLVVTGLMRWVYLATSYATFPIGVVLSYLLMAGVYYLLFSPLGMLMRLFGYDPMHRHFDRQTETYWTPRQQDDSIKRYFKQF